MSPDVSSSELESYRVADFFVVRSPLLPVQRLLAWSQSKGTAVGPKEAGDESARLARGLRDELEDPALRKAIFFSSPQVHEALTKGGAEALSQKLQRSLLRYFLRATLRETPFGLLAGNSVGRIGVENHFELPPRSEHRSRTRISLSFLLRFMERLAARNDVREQVPYEPNASLTRVQANYRFTADEPETVYGQARLSSTVSEVIGTAELEKALELSRGGRTLREIAEAMLTPGLGRPELLDFCHGLVEAKLLVPAWLPSATGVTRTQTCVDWLAGSPELDASRTLLSGASALLRTADAAGVDAVGDEYRAARERLLGFVPSISQPLQTDLVKPAPQLSISEELANQFRAAAELLVRTGMTGGDPALAAFRRRFLARYDRRLVPLAEALDGDVGVGFGDTDSHVEDRLVTGLPFASGKESAPSGTIDRLRIDLLERALRQNVRGVEIDESILEELPRIELAHEAVESFTVVARLCRDAHDRLLVVAPRMGASTVALLGRFCEADPEMQAAVSRHAQLEQRLAGDTILADVVYCPNDDSANVVARPVLREYEIPLGGRSGAPLDRQLPLSDLLVGVEDDRIGLYSRRLKKRIAIRVANAHNHDQASLPTIYRFLGALQHEDSGALSGGWTWGPLEQAPFLPRVTCGDTVLSLARWTISAREWAPLFAAASNELADRLRDLRTARDLPRFLIRFELDRRLIVDLENPLSVEELLHEARQVPQMQLEEVFPEFDQLVLKGPEGSYAAEFVVPFVRRSPLPARAVPEKSIELSSSRSRRCHGSGSDWLYARIYSARSRSAALLRALRSGVVEPSVGSAAKLWFYLPFSDPDPHLRLRFQGDPAELRSVVLSRLERTLDPLFDDGSVYHFELGTYEPELERYGGAEGVRLAERLFFADSDAASQLVLLAEDDYELRWQLALLGIDRLLSDFGADLDRRAELVRRASESFGEEMGANNATWKTIGDRYRTHASAVTRCLWESGGDEPLEKARSVLAARSARIAPIWSELSATLRRAKQPVDDALPLTFAHLHAVRVLGVTGRAHELVLYEFLRRQYDAARSTRNFRR